MSPLQFKFITYRGQFFDSDDDDISLSDLYFIAKNPGIVNITELLKISKMNDTMGCEYCDEVMHELNNIRNIRNRRKNCSRLQPLLHSHKH